MFCFISTVLVLNALLGLILFEWSWANAKPIREIDEKRDSKYPAFRRYDALHWKKRNFYLGAVTLMPFRLISMIVYVMIVALFTK